VVAIKQQAYKRLLDAGARFGLTPSDRNSVRAAAKPTKEDDKKKFFGERA